MSAALAAAAHFALGGPPGSAEPLAGGHIHESWRVLAGGRRWVLQRLNTSVFADPEAVMANLVLLAGHVASVVGPVPAVDGGFLWSGEGGVWRTFPHLEGTSPPRPPYSAAVGRELGRAFGAFHLATADLDPARLVEVIPRFHDPARRLAQLADVVAADQAGRVGGCAAELAAVARARWVGGLAAGLRSPEAVPLRVAHFDAKADNVLFDNTTGAARAIVDLDTVMPGSLLWDVGDLIRSAACPVAEDAPDPTGALVDVAMVAALLAGYQSAVGPLLTAAERDGLVPAALVVTFEQALRFLTDHLDGDRYYRIARDGHNLDRARVQLTLLKSMIERRSAMLAVL